MLKKINMIIVAFFLILTIKGGFLFSIYLPVLLFYLLQDKKNIYYIYPTSFISVLIFARGELFLYLIVIGLCTIFLFFLKKSITKGYYIFANLNISIPIYLTIINLISFFIYPKNANPLILNIIYIILSILIYLFLNFYLKNLLKDIKHIKERILINDNKTYHTYIYLEILIAILTSLGACYITIFNLNLGIIVGAYFAMYLSRKFQNIYSLLYSILLVSIEYVILDIKESLIIVSLAGIYLARSIYTIGILNIFLAIIILTNRNYATFNIYPYIALMGLSVIFELISHFLIKIKVENVDEYQELHQSVQKHVNEEILKFASFLDQFVIGFQNPKDFNDKLSSGIKTMVDRHCSNCQKQKISFNTNKSTLYPIFKDILMLNEDAIYNDENFAKNCPKYPSLINTSKLLNEKVNYKDSIRDAKDANNYILLAQISGVSNALKNYVVDTISKNELNYQNLYKAKDYLIELEYYITYYEVMRNYEDDFLIVIGVKNTTFTIIKPVLQTLFEAIINQEVSIELVKEENTTLYIHVLPKLLIDITYAYGNIPALEEAISGDNYLIKEQNNGHILFAISDGMGKGYSAFYESNMTLKLVEDIVRLNVESSTALEILNTFYTVQDYLERYATLDFLDINRHTKIATFYKMGANTTYILKKNGQLDKIINKALPLGIDEEVDQNTYTLEDEDLIIMSSDGILENLIDNDQLEEFIKKIAILLPQQIVYEILNYTTTHEIKVKDDMTLIVLKIHKK